MNEKEKQVNQMTNKELAEAISAAFDRAGDASEPERIQTAHLTGLLAVQLARAKTCTLKEGENNA